MMIHCSHCAIKCLSFCLVGLGMDNLGGKLPWLLLSIIMLISCGSVVACMECYEGGGEVYWVRELLHMYF